MENDVLRFIYGGQQSFSEVSPIQVHINQFYGIEINDFAVAVAQAALWIAESQMMNATREIVQINDDFLPLKSAAHIVEGNSLRRDWNTVIPATELNYIMGNPPFVGASKMSAVQKQENIAVIGKTKKLVSSIDYVGGWYYKLADYIKDTNIEAALVSTNSITQGEQVGPLWKELLDDKGIKINFAHRTFIWDSQANEKAHVHCVIIGVSLHNKECIIFDGNHQIKAKNINPYLLDAGNYFIESHSTSICGAPALTKGNQATDDGNFILSEDEYQSFISKDENSRKYIKRFIGAKDFINNNEIRYCLWLKDVPSSVYRKNNDVMDRIKRIKEFRLASSAKPTRDFAERPYQFFSSPQELNKNYLVVPRVSSERRKYIPIGFRYVKNSSNI